MVVEGKRENDNLKEDLHVVGETDRQTDRQTVRQKDRQTDRHTDRQTNRHTDGEEKLTLRLVVCDRGECECLEVRIRLLKM